MVDVPGGVRVTFPGGKGKGRWAKVQERGGPPRSSEGWPPPKPPAAAWR